MNFNEKFVENVERFREEANKNEVVYELLFLISNWLSVDDSGSVEVTIDKNDSDEIRLLEACRLAECFSRRDISKGKAGWKF